MEFVQIGSECFQGNKNVNEDRYSISHSVLPKHDTLPKKCHLLGPFVAVYDGHGGIGTVEFIAKQIPKVLGNKMLISYKEFCVSMKSRMDKMENNLSLLKNHLREEEDTSELEALIVEQTNAIQAAKTLQLQKFIESMSPELIRNNVSDAYEQIDREWVSRQDKLYMRCGSTALVAFFVRVKATEAPVGYYISNLGDCRAVLCRDGKAVRLTNDHKPNTVGEKQRIRKAGGVVGQVHGIWRVSTASGAGLHVENRIVPGIYLSVSRGFGDPGFKRPAKVVSCLPDTEYHKIGEKDLFIVLACDGIYDVLSDQEVIDAVLPYFGKPKAAARKLIADAYEKNSHDNLTAIVVFFSWKQHVVHEIIVKPCTKKAKIEEENMDMFQM